VIAAAQRTTRNSVFIGVSQRECAVKIATTAPSGEWRESGEFGPKMP
jgi:hypothetical protein